VPAELRESAINGHLQVLTSEPKADKLAFLVFGMGSFFASRSDRLHTYFGRQVHRLF